MTEQQTYAIEERKYDEVYWFGFSFNAKSEKDARLKAWAWANYHGLSSNDYRVRVATESEERDSLHNEYVWH